MSNLYQYSQSQELQNLLKLVNSKVATVNTCVPCTIVSVEENFVTAQPNISMFYRDDQQRVVDAGKPSPIPNIPILFPGNLRESIRWTVQPGDTGILIICQGDTDSFYRHGVSGPRRFDFLDSVFIPLTMGVSASGMSINVNNHFSVSNKTASLIPVLVSALNAVVSAVTTGGQSLDPATQAAITDEINKLETFYE